MSTDGSRLTEVEITSALARRVRWLARATGLIVCAYYVGILVILPIANPEDNEPGTAASSLAAVIACLPILLAWRWQRLGGWLAIGGGALLCTAVFLFGAQPSGGAFEVALVLVLFGLPFVIFGAQSIVAARATASPGNDARSAAT